MVLTAG